MFIRSYSDELQNKIDIELFSLTLHPQKKIVLHAEN